MQEEGESEYSMNRAFLKMQVWKPVNMNNGAGTYQEGPAENSWRTLFTLEVIKVRLKDYKISRCTKRYQYVPEDIDMYVSTGG